MSNARDFVLAKKIKGYGSYKNGISDNDIQKVITIDKDLQVQPIVIRTLGDYINFIDSIDSTYTNPVFYRGQTNANYLLRPASLRKKTKNENLMIESFYRRFYSEMNKCNSSMEKLMNMQHFMLPTEHP